MASACSASKASFLRTLIWKEFVLSESSTISVSCTILSTSLNSSRSRSVEEMVSLLLARATRGWLGRCHRLGLCTALLLLPPAGLRATGQDSPRAKLTLPLQDRAMLAMLLVVRRPFSMI